MIDRYKFYHRISKMLKAVFFSSCCFASFNTVSADWNPDYLKPGCDQILLEDVQFQQLKTTVISCLENTWCSKEKATLIMDLVRIERPQTCVDIGAFMGWTLLPVAATLKYLNHGQVYAIDAWSNKEAILGLIDEDPNKNWWGEMDMQAVYNTFIHNVNTWNISSVCQVLYKPSRNAIHDINSIDFLHIDGNYSEAGSYEDVSLYLPKVKKGGYILYTNIGWIVDSKMPRIKAFQLLLDSCEIVSIIDNNNSFLVRKLTD